MGDLVLLGDHREEREWESGHPSGRRPSRPALLFDLASPSTYLAAERAERLFGELDWCAATPVEPEEPLDLRACRLLQERAAALRLPLIWPEAFSAGGRRAMRVAALAAERRRGAPFVLAMTRLAFCGGFDIDEPEAIAEAAAASGLPLEDALEAARDTSRDASMAAQARLVEEAGGDCLPALRVRGMLFCGEERLEDAAAVWRARPRPVQAQEPRVIA
jgi:2-hydroxychromene-2-carboxylate isomerase